MSPPNWPHAVLVCPRCTGTLTFVSEPPFLDELRCEQCRLAYPIRDGIPHMLVSEARPF